MLAALTAALGGPLVASLGGFSALAAALPLFKRLRRFKWPILILATLGAGATLGLVGLNKHDAAIERLRSEASETGRAAEEAKWRLAAAAIAERNRVARQQDQAKIRELGIALVDARATLREKQNDFDAAMLQAQNDDAAAGSARNMFDPRVVRALNAGRARPQSNPAGGG